MSGFEREIRWRLKRAMEQAVRAGGIDGRGETVVLPEVGKTHGQPPISDPRRDADLR